eukprot:TRINITY_DN7820_c0_g1_i1.p1 TRINITY_DN7820_c0_g1~~TRINITY_DN7820_c0_g1_i1.p1  ORF type:complete len:942 (+),score=108.03 TRINITY_DN7820_c0_g1_i1:30-2828(+)
MKLIILQVYLATHLAFAAQGGITSPDDDSCDTTALRTIIGEISDQCCPVGQPGCTCYSTRLFGPLPDAPMFVAKHTDTNDVCNFYNDMAQLDKPHCAKALDTIPAWQSFKSLYLKVPHRVEKANEHCNDSNKVRLCGSTIDFDDMIVCAKQLETVCSECSSLDSCVSEFMMKCASVKCQALGETPWNVEECVTWFPEKWLCGSTRSLLRDACHSAYTSNTIIPENSVNCPIEKDSNGEVNVWNFTDAFQKCKTCAGSTLPCYNDAILGPYPTAKLGDVVPGQIAETTKFCLSNMCMENIKPCPRTIIQDAELSFAFDALGDGRSKAYGICSTSPCVLSDQEELEKKCYQYCLEASPCSRECVAKIMDCMAKECELWDSDNCVTWYPRSGKCVNESKELKSYCDSKFILSTSGGQPNTNNNDTGDNDGDGSGYKNQGSEMEITFVVGLVLGAMLTICACIVMYCCCLRKTADKPVKSIKEVSIKDTRCSVTAVVNFLSAGKWTKGELIGRGTFGSVYLALLPGGNALAVKQLDASSQTQADVQSYTKEVTLMRELEHPNVVRYFFATFSEADQLISLFMEYVPGGSLGRLVRKTTSRLSETQGIVYLRQICTGLDYLHSRGVVHRDIKGDNILIDTSEGVCKISDFGSSKKIQKTCGQQQTIAKTITGTPNWMAPEMITDITNTVHDEKVDVWSIGCTVVEILNKGNPPWPEFPTQWAAIYHIANSGNIPEVPSFLSKVCADFVLMCLRRNSSDRPTVSTLLKHPWLVENEPLQRSSSSGNSLPVVDEQLERLIQAESARKSSGNPLSSQSMSSVKLSLETHTTTRASSSSFPEHRISMEDGNGSVPSFKVMAGQAQQDDVLVGTVPSFVVREYQDARDAAEMGHDGPPGTVPSFSAHDSVVKQTTDDEQVLLGTVPSIVVRAYQEMQSSKQE